MVLEEFLDEWHNDNPTVLVHTSGSTGKPKPMWVEKQKMLNSARITCDFLGLKPGDSALLCMPLDYIAGKMVVVRAIERKLKLVNIAPCGHPMANAEPDVCCYGTSAGVQLLAGAGRKTKTDGNPTSNHRRWGY